jgi:hypothetical protein
MVWNLRVPEYLLSVSHTFAFFERKRVGFSFMMCVFILALQHGLAQHQELQEKPAIWQSKIEDSRIKQDTSSFLKAFQRGKMNGHIRYFFSQTTNRGDLSDYYANALGGGIRFETDAWHGFSSGISGFYIFNLGSSSLGQKDAATGQINRYELGLFDVANPSNTQEINRLEELFLQYRHQNTRIIAGRQLINTPFINLQDGRMRPTAVEGIWTEHVLSSRHQLQAGWIYGIAPRGTRTWYSLASSIGVYASGVGIDGVKSNYAGNVNARGAALFNYTYKAAPGFTATYWHLWVENVMHTGLAQLDFKNIWHSPFHISLQSILQTRSGDGGNPDPGKRYYTNEKPVWTTGLKVVLDRKVWNHTLAFNYIAAGGRYLMPREWGRDPFFTFLPRERNEGFGDVFAAVLKSQFQFLKKGTLMMAAGYFGLPGPENVRMNKYGMPPYGQILADTRYRLQGVWKGWEIQVLYTYKFPLHDSVLPLGYQLNKVNMHLTNVVCNFYF